MIFVRWISVIILILALSINVGATVSTYNWTFPSDAQSWTAVGACSGSSCTLSNGWNSSAPTSIWFSQSSGTTQDRTTESSRQSPNINWVNGTPTNAVLNFSYRVNMSGSLSSVTPSARIMYPNGTSFLVWSLPAITATGVWNAVSVSVGVNNFTNSGNYIIMLNGTLFTTNSPATATANWDSVNLNMTWTPAVTYMPPKPINIANTSGNYWVNVTVQNGTGNITNSMNKSVSINGGILSWTNNSNLFLNTSGSTGDVVVTTFYAYNSSSTGRLNTTGISNTTTLPYNINITSHGNNKTNNNSLSFNVNQSEVVSFNLTTNMTINSNTTSLSSGVNWLSNSTLGLLTFWANFSFPTYGQQFVNLSIFNSTSQDSRNWSVFVNDITPPNQVTGLTNTSLPTATQINLGWTTGTDNTGGSEVKDYFVQMLNNSFYWLTVPRPNINATGISAGYEQDAYWYTFRNVVPVNCTSCHGALTTKDSTIGNFWVKYNSTHIFIMVHAADNDTSNNDDSIVLGFDVNNNDGSAPQTDDKLFELYENNTIQALVGTGTGWASTTTNAITAIAGAGSNAPRYEIAIPLSELGNPTNGSMVGFFLEVQCTNGSDFVQRHTYFNDSTNETTPTNWNSITYRNSSSWITIGNPTTNAFSATGLSHNFRYNFSVFARDNVLLNGSRSSSYIGQTADRNGYNLTGFVNASSGMISGTLVWTGDYQVQTNATGFYEFDALANGTYTVNASYLGRPANSNNIVTINGADQNNKNFTVPINITSNISQLGTLNHNVNITKTRYPLNYSTNISDEGTLVHDINITKTIAPINYISNVSQIGTINHDINITKTRYLINYTSNVSQIGTINHNIQISKISSGSQNYTNVSQVGTMVHSINITKTIAPVNYTSNITQLGTINHNIMINKTTAPINYSINVSQGGILNHNINITKTVMPINYYTNISQIGSINHNVNITKTIAPINYSTNISQIGTINHNIDILKSIAPVNYSSNVYQIGTIEHNILISKTVALVNYSTNISQLGTINHNIKITKTTAPKATVRIRIQTHHWG